MSSGGHLSKEFFELVKSIGESRSKQEEDLIIQREVTTLKKAMAEKQVTNKQMKEYIVRMLYVEMLGHDASFGHIQAVKMVSTKDLMMKRVGYLGCSLTLHAEHQFMLLLVNTLQTDLRSDNYLETCMALMVIAKLVNAELIPVLLPLVVKTLDHAQAHVRKKAIVVLHRFYQIDPTCLSPLMDKIRKVLCDKDPSVMGASLWLFIDVCAANPSAFKDLVPSFVSILKQVTEHRLPRDYDYHRMPAPWIQLCLLQVLSLLGTADKSASEGMYEILHEVMKRADIGINVGYAIVYEAVRAVTTIYPDNALIEEAARAISRFIASDNHNLKYLGINALSSIVQINPKYAVEHQMAVIDCLEDTDETLKRKTLDLLYNMTNPANVVMVVDKLSTYLKATTDTFLRTDLVNRITQLAEKFAPNNAWYINTMNSVFELGGELVQAEVAHNLMRVIVEGAAAEQNPDGDIRHYAVQIYLELLNKPVLPDILYQVAAWIIGEYGYLSVNPGPLDLINRLCDALDRPFEHASTRAWFLSAIMKLCAFLDHLPPRVDQLIRKFQSSMVVDLQQRSHEFHELSKDLRTMRTVLPQERAGEAMDIDEDLHFLDAYVNEALANGASPYNPPSEGGASESFNYEAAAPAPSHPNKSSLKTTPYANPTSSPSPAPAASRNSSQQQQWGRDAPEAKQEAAPEPLSTGLKVSGKAQLWGPSGFNSATPEPVKAAPSSSNYGTVYDDPTPSNPSPAQPTYNNNPYSAPAKKVEKERVLTDKERTAMSLFAGLGDSGSAASSPPAITRTGSTSNTAAASFAPRAPTQPAPVAPAPAPAPAAKPAAAVVDLLSVDMFDMAISTPAQPPPQAQPASAPAGFMNGRPAATAAPAPAARALDPLESLFGGGPLPSAAPAPAPVPAQPALFGGLSMAPVAAPAPAPVRAADPLADLFGGSFAPAPQPAAQPNLLQTFVPNKPEQPLVPEPLSTPQYGAMWKQLPPETKMAVAPSSCTTAPDFMSRMQGQLNMHPVQTIGQEMICAGKQPGTSNVVLVHGKLKPGRVEVMIKSNNPQAINTVSALVRKALQ